MSKKDYIEVVKSSSINNLRKDEVSRLFHNELNDLVLKIISVADSIDFFDEEKRALYYSEIIGASDLLGIDAVSQGIVPLIDAYDGIFIVYLLTEKKWAKFSISDKSVYMKRDSLSDLL